MLEPVVEDLYVEETSSHPDLYKRCKRQNSVVERVTLKEMKEKLEQENRLELKKIRNQEILLASELRKLVIDKSIYSRTDLKTLRSRRKSKEFEDLEVSTPEPVKSASSHLTAFIHYNKTKAQAASPAAAAVKHDVIKRAMSDEELESFSDLRAYQHWEGDPEAINSVRRTKKSRAAQLEQLAFCRSRKFDQKNQASPGNSGHNSPRVSGHSSPRVSGHSSPRVSGKDSLLKRNFSLNTTTNKVSPK